MTDDEYLDHTLQMAKNAIEPRALLVSLVFLASLLMLDVAFGKAFCVSVGLYTILRLPIGRRYVERLAVVLFMVAAAYWIDIVPLKKWGHSVVAAVDIRIDSLLETTAAQAQ
jgi:hypothetical protein